MIEDEILEHLRGEADYDVTDLLRKARSEIVALRKRVSDLGWEVDYHARRAEIASTVNWI